MSLSAALGLAAAMIALAALPSSSVLLVLACTLRGGAVRGGAAALGIVVADLLFIALAMTGVAALAQALGALFVVVKICAGLCLLGLGLYCLVSRPASLAPAVGGAPISAWRCALAGLLVTLADVKAVVFYASLLPLFVEPQTFSTAQAVTVALITVVSVGGVKLLYVGLAQHLAGRLPGLAGRAQKLAGAGLVAASGVMLLRD